MDHDWDIRESGPADAQATVLLLPGGLCTGAVFSGLMGALEGAPVRVVAATLPGFGRTTQAADSSIEHWAALAGRLAAEIGADVVGGHSLGANVALEMAASGAFDGPLLLLSPTFSAVDEDKGFRILARLGRIPVMGAGVWRLAVRAMPHAIPKDAPDREVHGAMFASNDPAFCRRTVNDYFDYFDRRSDLAGALCTAGVRATVAFGDHKEVGLTARERERLEACPQVRIATVNDATHFLIIERPEPIAELVLDIAGVAVDG